MKFVERGLLLPGAVPITNGNVCPVWRGFVDTPKKRRVTAFVKHVPPRELVVEVVAALLGRVLQLPIPRPLLVDVLPVSAPPNFDKSKDFWTLFGSERVDHPDLATYINPKAADDVLNRLRRWPKAVEAGCFDEWIANGDRHVNNVLYDGRKDFVLIDHSHAIPREKKPSEAAEANRVADILTNKQSPSELAKLEIRARAALVNYSGIPLEKLLDETLKSELESFHSSDELIEFLQERLNHIGNLVAQRFGSKQGDMISDSLNDN